MQVFGKQSLKKLFLLLKKEYCEAISIGIIETDRGDYVKTLIADDVKPDSFKVFTPNHGWQFCQLDFWLKSFVE